MTRASALALIALSCWTGCVPDRGRPEPSRDVYRLVSDAEDARTPSLDPTSPLLVAASSDDPFLRRVAVRALGRLERPALAVAIEAHLDDEDASVRAAAAEALAQSVHGQDGAPVLAALLDRVGTEPDPSVRGMLGRSIGRLRLEDAERRRAARALVELAGPDGDAPEETREGVALGFESLVRLSGGAGLGRRAADVLVTLMTSRADTTATVGGHTRALAASALGQSRRLSFPLIRNALDDPEPEVRRVVLGYLSAVPPALRDGLLRRALADSSERVQTAAVLYLGGVPRTEDRCELLLEAAAPDRAAGVRLTALGALSRPCPSPTPQRRLLEAAISELGEPDGRWQVPARALLSLAGIDPDAAAARLEPFVEHRSPFVRTWAARTAAAVGDAESLFALAVDPSPNVRSEAVPGLFRLEGHDLDDFLIGQLGQDDPGLLRTVAALLQGAPEADRVGRAAVEAFERISRSERETWRDVRLALLGLVGESGDSTLADPLAPYLRDYDARVADSVSTLLERWTGRPAPAEPRPLPRPPVPTLAELRLLERSSLTLRLGGGDSLVVELLADQATTNVARLVRLTEAGYYDGLTFHRWVPNFVVQGGSPAANEFEGDGPYTRDEVGGMPHWRGTVGVSTRGRDTGDGQIFINLVDNPRLNYDFTVVGRVVAGDDVLDRILEGTVIERADVTTGG